jgi:hypothetical protein
MTVSEEGGAGTRPKRFAAALLAGLIAAAGVLVFVLANTHLVYVAVTSQPECVAHLKAGEAASGKGAFSAAKPAC